MDQLALPGDAAVQAGDQPVTRAEFARIMGVDEAYVRRLAKAGRLAITDGDRPLVHVEASLRKLEATTDLSKRGVRERWAAYRAARGWLPGVSKAPDPLQQAAPAPATSPAGGAMAPRVAATEPSEYHRAQTDLTRANAAIRMLELRQRAGELAEVAPMVRAMTDAQVAARNAVLELPDRLAAQLAAEADPARVHALITAEAERICSHMQRALGELARKAAAPVAAA